MGEQEGGKSPEVAIDRWEYKSHFEPYLVRLAMERRNGLESLGHFPKRIELSPEWHVIHEQMREDTKDKRERWTPISFRKNPKDIYIPQKFIIGSKTDIPPSAFYKGLGDEYLKLGMSTILGDIHSHPGWGKSFWERFLRTGRIISEYKGFSPSDMFRLVEPDGVDLFIFGVVDSEADYYAFVTKETQRLDADSSLSKSDEFQNYWFYKYTRAELHKQFTIKYPKVFSLWDVDLGIARQYNIALFKGIPGEDLTRIYPE